MESEKLPEMLLLQADSQEIEAEIEKAKSKPMNKGKSKIFVAKYNKYFPADRESFLQCDRCQKWRKVKK